MRSRYAYFRPFATAGELIPSEEEASSWLLQSPWLLNWPRKINWLGSRVDPRKSASRLWGVDSIGSLIIVEIKIDRGEAPDPFESFVFDVKRSSANGEWTAESLRRKWRKRSAGDRGSSDAHQRRVERSLARRGDVGNPHPVFFGVVASVRSSFRLSHKATKNREQLQKRVGDERVLLRVMSGTLKPEKLRVQCKAPNDNNNAGGDILR